MTQLKILILSATLAVLCLICLCEFSHAANTVIISPLPQLQFFDQGGRPLSFGCVFSYQSGTTTPIATYTDYTGNIQNANPVILSAGGSANIWLLAGQAYTLRVKAAGGTQCASGSQLYSISGIGGGTSQTVIPVPYSPTPAFAITAQNTLFTLTLTGNASASPLSAVGIVPPALVTIQITQDLAGGHTFSWPANWIGGCTPIGLNASEVTTQMAVWNGTNATAIGSCIVGDGPHILAGQGDFSGDVNVGGNLNVTGWGIFGTFSEAPYFRSTTAIVSSSGRVRLGVADAIYWRNNGDSGDIGIATDASDRGVFSFSGGIELNGTTNNIYMGGLTASFPLLKRNATAVNFRLADDSADAPISAAVGTFSGHINSTATDFFANAKEVSTPSPPGTGTQNFYPKASNGLCSIDNAGVEYCPINVTLPHFLASRSITSCTLAAGGGQWYCQATFSWGSTLSTSTYKVLCTVGQPALDPSVDSGAFVPVLTVGTKSTTGFGYTLTDDHSSSNGNTYPLDCVATT